MIRHKWLTLTLLVATSRGSVGGAAETRPLADAIAVWQMADSHDSAGKNSSLTSHGDVRLGVALTGAEREASLRRGGDGMVAEFRGGWLSAGQGADGELNPSGKALTLCVRLRDPSGRWNTPLFSKHGGHNRLTYNLFSTDLGAGTAVGFELGTDHSDRPLQLAIPVARIRPTDWHDIVVRYRGAVLELFVDGVLVDEEWPIGSLRSGNTEPCLIGAESYGGQVKGGFHGLIDHAALWDRALTDAEVEHLSGGPEAVAHRRDELIGKPEANLQYWKPPAPNTYVGDCMPFFHDGTFHLFYLIDHRHHHSKWGLGAHQWAHASTRDLVHWTHHPIAIPITEEREGSICTGSVFFHGGTFYAYYATRKADGSGERLSLATSADGIHFQKTLPNPFAGPEKGYGGHDYRDPNVFLDPRTGEFHMLVAARLADARGGCLAQLLSRDLRSWTLAEPFLVTGFVPECPDHFAWNGWNYLISTRYWMSLDRLGPWTTPPYPQLDALPVPKTAEFTGNRRIYAAWMPERGTGFGGCTVFREVVQNADGTLGTRFVPEMIPKSGKPVSLRVVSTADPVRFSADIPPGAESRTVLAGLPRDARITLRVTPGIGTNRFGLRLGAVEKGPHAAELELRFAAAKGEAVIDDGPRIDGLDAGRPLDLDIILKGDILDVSIDHRRTVIGRVNADRGDTLVLFAHPGNPKYDQLEVHPLE